MKKDAAGRGDDGRFDVRARSLFDGSGRPRTGRGTTRYEWTGKLSARGSVWLTRTRSVCDGRTGYERTG